MATATKIEQILPGIFRWEAFSPAHKVELTSHAVLIRRRLYIFDPIPLEHFSFQQLVSSGVPTAIILTNDNHERDAAQWRERLRVPIWAAFDANLALGQVYRFGPGMTEWLDWKLGRVTGGSNGEIAFFWRRESLLILGDAVTNLPGYDLMLLSEKYCDHQPTLHHSLNQLLATPFEKLLLAHGRPILDRASAKIERLLA
jgi:glyoxylase-like metal-dependent hydrolase (beta-lactamase superfamily II)